MQLQFDFEKLKYNGYDYAHCKNCYKTHRYWKPFGFAWICSLCDKKTADEVMNIQDVPEEIETDEEE